MREFLHPIGMIADPEHKDLNDLLDLILGERLSGGDAMPFPKTFPAAASGRMLGDETGMSPHRGLFPVMERLSRSKPFFYETAALRSNDVESVFRKKPEFCFTQREAGSEFGSGKSLFQDQPVFRSHENPSKWKRTGPRKRGTGPEKTTPEQVILSCARKGRGSLRR